MERLSNPERDFGDFGAWLRGERRRANLTQVELARLVGCSHRSIQAWESALNLPGAQNRRRLLAFFRNLDPEALEARLERVA